jgi:hypothetical protein
MVTASPAAAIEGVAGKARSPIVNVATASTEAMREYPNRTCLIFGEELNT